jgi:phenylacetate-CoA ligase
MYQLERSQWWPADVLRQGQLRQLESLLVFAARTVPFYREWLSEFGTLRPGTLTWESWRRIPLLSRGDIQSAGDAFETRRLPKAHGPTRSSATSGSTGEPVKFKVTPVTSQFLRAVNLRSPIWHGRDFAAKTASINRLSETQATYSSENRAVPWAPGYGVGQMVFFDIHAPVEAQLEWLAGQQPQYILTLPWKLRQLIRASVEGGIALPSLRQAASLGEVLDPELRAECRDAWGIGIADSYSCEETGLIAIECPDHPVYHVQSECALVEVLDEDGRPCAPGEIGKVVITDLHNFATLLIRYELGDFAAVGEACACGRGLPILDRIMGRRRNRLIMPSGGELWPSHNVIFTNALGCAIPELRQGQIVQRTLRDLDVRLVVGAPVTPDQEERARSALRAAVSDEFECRFVSVDSLARSSSAKVEPIVSELGD